MEKIKMKINCKDCIYLNKCSNVKKRKYYACSEYKINGENKK